MITSKIKNIDTPERNYNYLKSIKDNENIILAYYKKLSHLETDKPKILPKIKKRTLKKNKIEDTKEYNITNKNGDELHDTKKYSENNTEKKTKKQIVIMDD